MLFWQVFQVRLRARCVSKRLVVRLRLCERRDQEKCPKGCFGTASVYLKVWEEDGNMRIIFDLEILYEIGKLYNIEWPLLFTL